jgi:formylmethanofuran dehydrogenase subunit B
MTERAVSPPQPSSPWTCPFCPLLCDDFGVDMGRPGAPSAPLALLGGDCPVALRHLAAYGNQPSPARPRVAGQPADLDTALAAAVQRLGPSLQPLFGGLGTDVAGARALYALACETGAICDPAAGAALMHGLRALQDRGAYTTTLAEVRERADLIVCLGGSPAEHYPEFYRRCGLGSTVGAAEQGESADDAGDTGQGARQEPPRGAGHGTLQRALVLLGGDADAQLSEEPGLTIDTLPLHGDLHTTVALLAALVDGRHVHDAPDALVALAEQLNSARYAVLVWQSARLPAHGALVVEAINRIVASLNRKTRAAALPLGGGNGAGTVNQVYTWLSGLPLRSRATPAGLEHEPLRFDATQLLADGSVDLLLWVSAFGGAAPPDAGLPRIVLGSPALAAAAGRPDDIYIPVSTPGIGTPGHLFRTDSSVLLPLRPVYADTLPSVADVVQRLTAALRAQREAT